MSKVKVLKKEEPEKASIHDELCDIKGIDSDRTFLKFTALLQMYYLAINSEEIELAECELYGLKYLGEDLLSDLELLVYGERTWLHWLDSPKSEEKENSKE